MKKLLLLLSALWLISCADNPSHLFGTFEFSDKKPNPFIHGVIVKKDIQRQNGVIIYFVWQSPVDNNTGNKFIVAGESVRYNKGDKGKWYIKTSTEGNLLLSDKSCLIIGDCECLKIEPYEFEDKLIANFHKEEARKKAEEARKREEEARKERERISRENNPIKFVPLGPKDYEFYFDHRDHLYFRMETDLLNVSDRTFIAADFIDDITGEREGFGGDKVYDYANARLEIKYNEKFVLRTLIDFDGGDWNYEGLSVGYKNPWKPNTTKKLKLKLSTTSLSDPIYPSLLRAPQSCTLYIPISLEDPSGYKKEVRFKFDFKNELMEFANKRLK